jgi:hypothetical protein
VMMGRSTTVATVFCGLNPWFSQENRLQMIDLADLCYSL